MLNSGRTRDAKMLEIIREIAYLSVCGNFQIKAVHLHGRENRISDKLSRTLVDEDEFGKLFGFESKRIEVSDGDFNV